MQQWFSVNSGTEGQVFLAVLYIFVKCDPKAAPVCGFLCLTLIGKKYGGAAGRSGRYQLRK